MVRWSMPPFPRYRHKRLPHRYPNQVMEIKAHAPRRSVVGVPLMITLRAGEEDCTSFVCRPQLLGVESHFRVAAFLARLLDHGISLHVGF